MWLMEKTQTQMPRVMPRDLAILPNHKSHLWASMPLQNFIMEATDAQ